VLLTTQRWKHAMLLAHCASFRQLSVCEQQLPTTHWLHGVPPGSSEQLPASIGGLPQCVPKHTSPTQHCGVLEQFDPGGRHAPAPQIPFWHTFEQHSPGMLHENPSSLHWFAPQIPRSHTLLQHSLGWLHPNPSGVHIWKPHVLEFGSQNMLQHCDESMQKAPSGWHTENPHVPLLGLQN